MANQSGTLTSSQGSAFIGTTPNDVITFTPSSGTYTVEYPLGTTAIGASTSPQSLSVSGGQVRVTCATGSVSWSVSDGNDGTPLDQTELSSVRSLVSGDGIRLPAGSDSVPLDVFDLYSTGLPRKLTLPSPYSAVGPAMVHPSVVYVPNRWMGWRYWMAVTPYPLNDSQYENPCVLVSQDGEVWEVPAGLSNPVVAKPATGYNADTELVLSPDGSRLYLIFRERLSSGTTGNNVRCMESPDGIMWSAPRTILSGATARRTMPARPSGGMPWPVCGA